MSKGGVPNECPTSVRIDGHDYFVISRDRSRGDRSSDGQLNNDFFFGASEEPSLTMDVGVRASQRLQKKSRLKADEESVQCLEVFEDETTRVETNSMTPISVLPAEVEDVTTRVETNRTTPISVLPVVPRLPDKCLKCAGRKRTARLLWLHEFYIVFGNQRKKTNPYIYQALQFLVGAELPAGVVPDMTEKQRREIWVLGISYVPAEHLRQYSHRQKGYLFHKEVEEADADKSLYGKCPEIVRVENCLKWHAMCTVERSVPRVIHANDVKQRRFHVAGRRMHYVCGVSAKHELEGQSYKLGPLPRGSFAMYPEERFGMEIQSSSIMWENIEDLFKEIRKCMSAARNGTASGTFKMAFSVAAYAFWKVRLAL